MSELTFDEIRERFNKALRFGIYTTEAEQYVSGLLEAAIQRAEAANARVAELEFAQRGLLEQLDAQQWRSATEPPGDGYAYPVLSNDALYLATYDGSEWWDASIGSPGTLPVAYWLPIPPMPEEPQ